MLKKTTVIILFWAAFSGLRAQNAASDFTLAPIRGVDSTLFTTQDTALREVVVTAFRVARATFTTPEAVGILTKKQIERLQSRTTPELLFHQNAVFVQKTNHGGGSPFLRGLTGNQTLMLIDGIRLNNATFRFGPNQYLNTIDPFTLESAEILRGSGSVGYGSDAMGGVVQLFTKNPTFSNKNNLNGQFLGRITTQNMEQTGRATVDFSGKKVAFTGGFSYRNFGDLVGGDTTGVQNPTGYRERAFDLKAKFDLSKDWFLTVAHQNMKQNDVPIFHRIKLENFKLSAFEPQIRQLTYARLDKNFDKKILKKAALTASYQTTEEGRRNQRNNSSVRTVENDRVRAAGLSLQVETQFSPRWTAVSGVETYHDFVKSARSDFDEKTNVTTAKRGLYPDGSTFLSAAAYSLHEIKWEKWQFSVGGRFNTFSIDVKDETLGKVNLTPSAFVWNASILRGWQNISLFATVNTTFRAPNIDDLGTLGIVDFRYETPNFSLTPEKSLNAQVGMKYQKSRFRAEAYVYRNALRNIITRVRVDTQKIQGFPLFKKENVEAGYIQGVESNFKANLTKIFSLDGGFTYTFGQNITKNEPLRRIPPLTGRLAINAEKAGWFATAEWLGATKQDRLAKGDVDDNRIPKGGTPAWWIANVYGGYAWKMLSINVLCQNLFNADYRTHGSGVNGMGRAATVTVRVSF